jgi:hypothetical protein
MDEGAMGDHLEVALAQRQALKRAKGIADPVPGHR